MEIKILQEKIAKALNNVSKVAAGAKTTLPILNNVLIRVADGKVSLTTTNLDMAVVDFLPATGAKDGVITAPAKLLADFITNLPHGEMVELKTDENKITVKAGEYGSVINGASADDFPELPQIEEEKVVKFLVPAEDFKAGMAQVMVAVSNDTARPALTGVYFNTNENKFYVAATDGYRLAERKILDKIEADVSAIVPTATLRTVLGLISEGTDVIEILFDEAQMRFRVGEVEITSKLVDGSFPDYRQLIPKESEIILELEKAELLRVTKLSALFAREVGGSVLCTTDAEEQKFVIASVANELGENKSEIKTKVEMDGKVNLNSRYLLDALNAIEGKKINMRFSNKLDPVVLKSETNNDYVHLIMPLKW